MDNRLTHYRTLDHISWSLSTSGSVSRSPCASCPPCVSRSFTSAFEFLGVFCLLLQVAFSVCVCVSLSLSISLLFSLSFSLSYSLSLSLFYSLSLLFSLCRSLGISLSLISNLNRPSIAACCHGLPFSRCQGRRVAAPHPTCHDRRASCHAHNVTVRLIADKYPLSATRALLISVAKQDSPF